MLTSCTVGSFVVVDAENLEQLATFHHRKEEISDIKFSPSGCVARHSHSCMMCIVDYGRDMIPFN